MKIDYKDIFFNLENALKEKTSFSDREFNDVYGQFKHYEGRNLTDDKYYNLIFPVVFYSGFKASVVEKKKGNINHYFSDFEEVSSYNSAKIEEMMKDPYMIRNKNKIKACINNAIVFKEIISQYGSFKDYIDYFNPYESLENLLLFKEEIQYKFNYFGEITSYHFMTDIGLPVLKPDRVIARIFKRLGLIEDEKQILKTVLQGQKFSNATELPIRYIDICFVKYGQKGEDIELGLDDGICLERNPKCDECGIKEYCNF